MVISHQHVCNNMEESFCIPATFLPLINCRRQTIEQIIFPGQGNTAWINSITWYSLSTQCGQFSRRSEPFFLFQRQFGDLPLEPSAWPVETNRIIELESACVDIVLRCGLLKVNPYLARDECYYANPIATALVFFHKCWGNFLRYQGRCLNQETCAR